MEDFDGTLFFSLGRNSSLLGRSCNTIHSEHILYLRSCRNSSLLGRSCNSYVIVPFPEAQGYVS